MDLSAGQMDKKVSIEAPTRAADGMGGFTVTYSEVAEVWASIWPISASEQIQANAVAMVCTHRVRIHYRSVVKPNWRLKHKGRYFNIVSVIDPNMNHRMLELLVKEAA